MKGHVAKNYTKTQVWCTWCKRDHHYTIACKTRGRYSSTPYESPSAGNYHPTQSPNRGRQPFSPVEPHITRPSPTPSGDDDWAKLQVTRLEENEENTREVENQKRYLDNIEVFNRLDKTKCLTWVNQVQQAAICSKMTFRQALLAKAGPTVFGIIASTPPNTENQELKKIIFQNFSDIATAIEAAEKLKAMRMPTEQPIVYYNNYYAAVHKATFDLTLDQQCLWFTLEDYTNTLPEYTARKLSGKIVKSGTWLKTLQDAMNQADKIDQELRQWEVMKKRRDSNSDTTIDPTVNEISDIDINFLTARHGDNRFNSTMKTNYSP